MLEDAIEHRLEIARRTADDLQDFPDRREFLLRAYVRDLWRDD
jgi:hypothetical protein